MRIVCSGKTCPSINSLSRHKTEERKPFRSSSKEEEERPTTLPRDKKKQTRRSSVRVWRKIEVVASIAKTHSNTETISLFGCMRRNFEDRLCFFCSNPRIRARKEQSLALCRLGLGKRGRVDALVLPTTFPRNRLKPSMDRPLPLTKNCLVLLRLLENLIKARSSSEIFIFGSAPELPASLQIRL
jgi:hypothetical protein